MEKERDELLGDLFRAYFDTRRHKRNTRSQLSFEFNFEHNLIELCDRIADRTYTPAPAICFITEEPVKREIFASPFAHRVVCRLLYNYIAPMFEARMIHDSYSCRVGKGVFVGIRRFEHHLRSCTRNYSQAAYVLKLDLRGYFMSIDRWVLHGVLMRELDANWRKVSGNGRRWCDRLDRGLIDYLIRVILFRNPVSDCIVLGQQSDWDGLPPSKSLFHAPENVGLPIGDITSQLFSNILLDQMDRFVKRNLRCRHYGRYVDDFYVVHASRRYLKSLTACLQWFLQSELHLTLHPDKIVLQPYHYGVAFLGAYVKPYRRYATKSSVERFRRKIRVLEAECRRGELTYVRPGNQIRAEFVLRAFLPFQGLRNASDAIRKVAPEEILRLYGRIRKIRAEKEIHPRGDTIRRNAGRQNAINDRLTQMMIQSKKALVKEPDEQKETAAYGGCFFALVGAIAALLAIFCARL